MDKDLLTQATIDEVKNFITFKNTNNFDEYFSHTLPKTNIKFNYTFVSKHPLLKKTEEILTDKLKPISRRKNNPKRLEWVEFNQRECPGVDPFQGFKMQKNQCAEKKVACAKKSSCNPFKEEEHSLKNNKIEKKPTCKKSTKHSKAHNNILENIIEERNNTVEEVNLMGEDSSTTMKVDSNLSYNDSIYKYFNMPNPNDFSIKESEDDYVTRCLNCNWIYPSGMIAEEKNVHTNLCFDGKGEEHRISYIQSLESIHKEKYVNSNSNMDNNIGNTSPLSNVCPYCNKVLKLKMGKNITNHIEDCRRERENLVNHRDKKRTAKSKPCLY